MKFRCENVNPFARNLLIEPQGIEIQVISQSDTEDRLLIEPQGIEMKVSRRSFLIERQLLIEPQGIEICLQVSGWAAVGSFNRTTRN